MLPLIAAFIALSSAQMGRIDSIATMVMRQQHVDGLSLGVARNGIVLYLRGYGYRDADAKLPSDGYTIYPVGSITKQFTAALVLQDVARGRLALDAGNPPIRRLLDQTASGQWEYSNDNYARLGATLERLSGMGFCALLKVRILDPLQLISTSCSPPTTWNLATASDATARPIAPAAGGLWSNANDLLRWLAALRGGTVLPEAFFAAMTTSATLPGGVPVNYGFGFFVDNWYGYRVVHHNGFVPGFSSVDALSLDDGLAVVLLSNRAAVDLDPLAKSVVAIVDEPRDRNLSAAFPQPAENENRQITAALTAVLQTPGFEERGSLVSLEFVERTRRADTVEDTYRATFTQAQTWIVVGYDAQNAIVSLTIRPIDR
ncbi:MAG: beta-lactamase family protein [Candidatus Eremiobacteraeota bacterium]|nr:beta-lactamase family protein [Candidatus Eremiobacteraeota bacterium]